MEQSDADRIRALIHPLSLDEFLTRVWPHTFWHFSGKVERLEELIWQPDFLHTNTFVRCASMQIRAYYTRENKAPELSVTPERAVQLYESGCTLCVVGLSTEQIERWTRALDTMLALPPGTAIVNAFASTGGKGVGWHWDCQELFIVQVRGKKLWRVAPNDDLEWPTSNGSAGAQLRDEIRYQLKNPTKPVDAPKEWSTIEMTPGSVLFLPRGYWHTAENIDESLHLVLQVRIPSWRDIFMFLLQSEPELYKLDWRRPVTALRPEQVSDVGVKEFAERCIAISSLGSPAKIAALVKRFGESSRIFTMSQG